MRHGFCQLSDFPWPPVKIAFQRQNAESGEEETAESSGAPLEKKEKKFALAPSHFCPFIYKSGVKKKKKVQRALGHVSSTAA